jgi:hypothetical protein
VRQRAAGCGSAAVSGCAASVCDSVAGCAAVCGSVRQCAAVCGSTSGSVRQRSSAAISHRVSSISEAQEGGCCAVYASYNTVYHQWARHSKRGDACCTIVSSISEAWQEGGGCATHITVYSHQSARRRVAQEEGGALLRRMNIPSELVQKKAGASCCVVYSYT